MQTPAELLEAARRHGLSFSTAQTEFEQTGLDFLVVYAKDASGSPWIVRTPRRPDVYESSLVEARVLELVAPHLLPVLVPDWRLHTREVIAYPRLEGTPAVTLDAGQPTWNLVDPANLSDVFIESFAKMLAALQAISSDDAKAAGVPVKDVAETREHLAKAMDATREALEPSDALWARWQRWIHDDGVWPNYLAMTHGDLHPGHMLLDFEAKLIGVLDWTEAKVTDPSMDFAMFFGCFGKAALEKLIALFEEAGGRTWPGLLKQAEERWVAFPVLGAEWALRTGNQAVLEFAKAQLVKE